MKKLTLTLAGAALSWALIGCGDKECAEGEYEASNGDCIASSSDPEPADIGGTTDGGTDSGTTDGGTTDGGTTDGGTTDGGTTDGGTTDGGTTGDTGDTGTTDGGTTDGGTTDGGTTGDTGGTDGGTTDGGTTGDTGDTGEPPLSYAADIQPIWDAACAGCHTGGGTSGGLALDTPSYGAVVGVASNQSALNLIEPGSTSDSYLWHKLNGSQAVVGGTGTQMPQGGKLSADQLGLIETWIVGGANP